MNEQEKVIAWIHKEVVEPLVQQGILLPGMAYPSLDPISKADAVMSEVAGNLASLLEHYEDDPCIRENYDWIERMIADLEEAARGLDQHRVKSDDFPEKE